MNPKDIVYKMVVLGRRLTTHFILDIFWGSSFMFHVVLGFWLLVRAREADKNYPSAKRKFIHKVPGLPARYPGINKQKPPTKQDFYLLLIQRDSGINK